MAEILTPAEVGKKVTFRLGTAVASASVLLTHRGTSKTVALTPSGTDAYLLTDATTFATPGTYEYRVAGVTADGKTLYSTTRTLEVLR